MLFTNDEARDLEVFLRGLPARARDDERAIRVLAALFADLYELPAEHVIRRVLAEPSDAMSCPHDVIVPDDKLARDVCADCAENVAAETHAEGVGK